MGTSRGHDASSRLNRLALRVHPVFTMLQIQSRQLGTVDVKQEDILEFPNGVPGFEQRRRFVLVEKAEVRPIVFLQCVDDPEICFFTAPAALVDPRYQLAATPEDLRVIGLDDQQQPSIKQDVICLAVLAAPENGRWTANLLAPVLIEPRSRRGVQAVRMDSRYSHQHPIAGALCS
jgi:flagellar assembly factor FliW